MAQVPYTNMAESTAGPSSPKRTDMSISSISSINAQLITHGWAKRPLDLDALNEKDHNEVVSVLFELLGSSVTNLSNLDDLASRQRTLQYEHERLRKTYNIVLNINARLEGETTGWKAKCLDVEKKFQREESKVKELKEEVQRGRKGLEGVRIAAGHEAKKLQIKLDKANAALVKISTEGVNTGRNGGMVILNPIPTSREQPVEQPQTSLFEQTLMELAEIRQSLQEETEAFRHVAVSTGNALREALAAANGEEEPTRIPHHQFFSLAPSSSTRSSTYIHQTSDSLTHASLADIRLKSLIADVRAKLVERAPVIPTPMTDGTVFGEDSEEIKRVERGREKVLSDLVERVKDLEVEVVCAQGREEEAQKLVEEFAKERAKERVAQIVGDGDDELQRIGLDEQKWLIDEERRKITEATVRLTNERQKLEMERQAFIDQQRKIDADAVLALLPSTPSTSPGLTLPPMEADAVTIITQSTTTSTSIWSAHAPASPSPLSPHPRSRIASSSSSSPHKPRTPRPHPAGRKKMVQTPLRMVLEKAVREKGKDTATVAEKERLAASRVAKGLAGGRSVSSGSVSSGSSKGSSSGSGSIERRILGESGRRGNAQQPIIRERGKGKERVDLLGGKISTSVAAQSKGPVRSSDSGGSGGLGRSTGLRGEKGDQTAVMGTKPVLKRLGVWK